MFNHEKAGRVLISPKLLCSPPELPSCQAVRLQHVTKVLLCCGDTHNSFYGRLQVSKFTVTAITWPSSLLGLCALAPVPKVETDGVSQKAGI